MPSEVGKIMGGRWEIERLLARGGMGAVWVARHRITRETVALKLMYPNGPRQDELHERLLREAAAPAQIGHPGVVRVLDAGVDPDDGTLYIAMELLTGESLRDRLARPGTSRAAAIDLVVELLGPLAAAHALGFVHRDLKPQNAFVERLPDGHDRVKLLDFGLSRRPGVNTVTDVGNVMGTAAYLAPEQLRDARNVGPAADVWSVGVMLYQILAGRLPFEGAAAVLYGKILGEPPPSLAALAPDAQPALVALVERCLAKAPADRPADAGVLHSELRAILRPRTTPAPAPTAAEALDSAATAVTPAPAPPEPPILSPNLESAVTEKRPRAGRIFGVRVAAVAAAGVLGALLALLVAWLARDDEPTATTTTTTPAPWIEAPRPPPADVARPFPQAAGLAPVPPAPRDDRAPEESPLAEQQAQAERQQTRPSPPHVRQQQQEQLQQQLQQQQQAQQQQQQQQAHTGPAGRPNGTSPRDCGRIINATGARCFVDATGGNASGEYMLRNLILAYTLLGDRSRARALASRYFADYRGSPFAQQIRQLGYAPPNE